MTDWRRRTLKSDGPSSFASLVVEFWPDGKIRIVHHSGKVKHGVFAVESVGSKSKMPTDVDTALKQFDELAIGMKRAIDMASTEQGSPDSPKD